MKKQIEEKQLPESEVLKLKLQAEEFSKKVFKIEHNELCAHLIEARE